VVIAEQHPLFRDSVDIGRGVPVVSIASQVVSPQRVNIQIKYSHIIFPIFHETKKEGY
jgi:hypothetical protein